MFWCFRWFSVSVVPWTGSFCHSANMFFFLSYGVYTKRIQYNWTVIPFNLHNSNSMCVVLLQRILWCNQSLIFHKHFICILTAYVIPHVMFVCACVFSDGWIENTWSAPENKRASRRLSFCLVLQDWWLWTDIVLRLAYRNKLVFNIFATFLKSCI